MRLLGEGEHDLFIILVVLILGAFYIGFSKEGQTFGSVLIGLVNAATAQTKTGFKNYPGNTGGAFGDDDGAGDADPAAGLGVVA